ncbi:hypothetical protein EDD37DRAFT_237602 [Exophiala viscosa]|uniref:uncharacterized protein n=1 Tax=Exophiala viscosa TaxID=2486360 RepID=UPI00218DDB25|nr:hypothetical protein EDD37DRAFT_237602 [Exophiala viscosa]
MTSKQPIKFDDLPPEIRHQIYTHLFCHKPSPIPLGPGILEPRFGLPGKDDARDEQPTFYTALFRVNRRISRDALRFAYSVNSFQLTADLSCFFRLSQTALASIKTLTVFNNCWIEGRPSTKVWDILNQKCSSLETLAVQPSSHLLWQALPHLKEYAASLEQGRPRPRLVVDVYVWERHFSFDTAEHEYQRALQELNGATGAGGTRGFVSPVEMAMRLPRHVKQIDFVLDVNAGGVQALTEFLQISPDLPLVKVVEPLPCKNYRVGSRIRHCYVWLD